MTRPTRALRKGLIAQEQIGRFYETPPQINNDGEKSWLLRGNNFVLVYSELAPAALLSRAAQADEYVALMYSHDTASVLTVDGQKNALTRHRIAFVPPGDSSILLPQGGSIVRLFTPFPRIWRRSVQTLMPMTKLAIISRRLRRGPIQRMDCTCAAIRWMWRPSPDASGGFSAARRSW